MPIIKSAKKRVRVARKATVRNSKSKRSLKSAVKVFHTALSGDKKNIAKAHSKAQSQLDKAGNKHIIHKNKVARKKRQMAKLAKAASGVSKTPAKTIVKKTAPKKTAAKKPVAKKKTVKK